MKLRTYIKLYKSIYGNEKLISIPYLMLLCGLICLFVSLRTGPLYTAKLYREANRDPVSKLIYAYSDPEHGPEPTVINDSTVSELRNTLSKEVYPVYSFEAAAQYGMTQGMIKVDAVNRALFRYLGVGSDGTELIPDSGGCKVTDKQLRGLSRRELLELLASRAGDTVSRDEIEQKIFRSDASIIPVYVHYLRKKIDKGFSLKLLHTVRNCGYALSGI